MQSLQERINKLKESDLTQFLESSNDNLSKKMPSKRQEIDELYNQFKRRTRKAMMHAANEERAITMKIDILQNKIEMDEKKKRELEKQLNEAKINRDFLKNDIESQAALSKENVLHEVRENYLNADELFARKLQKYAAKEELRNELAHICLKGRAAIIDSNESDAYHIFLIDRADVDPIAISKSGSHDDIKRRAVEAVKTLGSSSTA